MTLWLCVLHDKRPLRRVVPRPAKGGHAHMSHKHRISHIIYFVYLFFCRVSFLLLLKTDTEIIDEEGWV